MDIPISAIVFDLGGVLIDWDPRYVYRDLFPDDEAGMERFLDEVCTMEWNRRMDAGFPWAEAVDALAAQHPEEAHLVRAYHERWREMVRGPFDDTVAILDELRGLGLPLYVLSNWSAETFRPTRERFDFLGWFDGLVVSGEEGMVKPDPAIFRILTDRYGVDPARALFIDDRSDNVDTARELGFQAILYVGSQPLREELVRRGLLEPRAASE
jgi:2-haloacid dehalogenase